MNRYIFILFQVLICFSSSTQIETEFNYKFDFWWNTRPTKQNVVETTPTTQSSSTTTATTTTATKKAATTTSKPTSPPVYTMKKATRQKLRTSLGGVTPEKRKKQLKQMAKKVKIEKISKNQSTILHKSYPKVKVSENPPALDLFEVNEKAGLNDYLFQGDINLNTQQLNEFTNSGAGARKKRQIMNSAIFWPGNVIYYYFDTDIGDIMKGIVRSGADFIQTRTCVSFVENSTATNRVKIINGGGCYSSVGMIGGEQTLSLGSGCDLVGTAAHELSHTLGVFHSQMRSDRDQFVTVDLTDVPQASQVNFVKYTTAKSTNLVEYEYGSFMHYSGKAFVSSGGVDSIVPKEPLMIYTMGGRIVTFMDIKMLNIHYSCSCPNSLLACANGGYPNPANCAECNCPYGFGGQLCNEKANYTCGTVLVATANWQSETFSFGNRSNSAAARPDFIFCNHWIGAPSNKQIQFRIDSAYNTQCGYGCTFNGIEPKLKTDQTMTQTRYCCNEFNGQIMTSEVNPLSIFSYNRYYYTNYTFSYRYVDLDVPVCENLSDLETCTSLKENAVTCSIYNESQLKVMCAVTFGYCGKVTTTPCSDRFSAEDCSNYKTSGKCTSAHSLIVEYSCAETCGFCTNPV